MSKSAKWWTAVFVIMVLVNVLAWTNPAPAQTPNPLHLWAVAQFTSKEQVRDFLGSMSPYQADTAKIVYDPSWTPGYTVWWSVNGK